MNGKTNATNPYPNTIEIPLDPVTNVNTVVGNSQIDITWTDPVDKYATPAGFVAADPQQIISQWKETVIIRKGNAIPTGIGDGEIVHRSQIRNQYQNNPFIDTGLMNGTMYGYGLIAINTDGLTSEMVTSYGTPSLGTRISDLPVGTIITITENDTPVEFFLAAHNYETDINGSGRDLLVRMNSIGNYKFDESGNDSPWLTTASIRDVLHDYLSRFSPLVTSMIHRTKYKTTYRINNMSFGVRIDEGSVFFISVTEWFGGGQCGSQIAALSDYLDLYLSAHDNYLSGAWTRSVNFSNGSYGTNVETIRCMDNNTYVDSWNPQNTNLTIPAFTIPSDMYVNNANALDEQATIVTDLSIVNEGDSVWLYEEGYLHKFIIAKKNYESDLNGMGRTLLVRDAIYRDETTLTQWNSSGINTYANSDIDQWLNTTYRNKLDPVVQSALRTTKFKYTIGGGNNTVSVLERSIFLPSIKEYGIDHSDCNVEGAELPVSDKLQTLHFKGQGHLKWSRTPSISQTNRFYANYMDGDYAMIQNVDNSDVTTAVPMFTLPDDFKVQYRGTMDGVIIAEQFSSN